MHREGEGLMVSKSLGAPGSFSTLYFVGFLHSDNSGVTVTEYNTKKPKKTRREGVKKSLHELYNVLIS